MSDKIFLNARYAFRSDTLENWQNINPVLEKGEPAVVTDGVNGEWLKIGDGTNAFNNLAWRKGPKGEQGIRGIQGDKGDKGDNYILTLEDKQEIANMVDVDTVTVDPTYSPTSENAQSGKAVAEAVDANKQYANNIFSAAIKNTVSGLVVSANDVSPIEHELKVKLANDTMTDFSGITVKRYGKNLYDLYDKKVSSFGGSNSFDATSKNDGRLTISSDNKKITSQHHCPIFTLCREKLPKGSYTLSFKCGFENSVPEGAKPNRLLIYFDGVQNSSKSLYDGSHNITLNLEKETTIALRFYKHIFSASTAGQGSEYASDTIYKANFWDIQLEPGKNATEYEEYKQVQEATANADGTVTGLTSISPNMTIMADNNGANINVTYNVDTKTYIDNKFAELAQAILNT